MGVLDSIAGYEHLPMAITATLECAPMTLGALMSLEPGAILPTRRSAGDRFDLNVGGHKVGQAEVVVHGHSIGVRITRFGDGS